MTTNHIANLEQKMDLINNNGLVMYRHNKFGKLACMQNDYVFDVFDSFFNDIKPLNVLEIGTALGGFTCFLRHLLDTYSPSGRLLSYDIADRPWFNDLRKYNIDIRVENIFFENYTSVLSEVVDFIQSPGVSVVLCDGAYKAHEFNLFAEFIKPGDFILAHDYSKTLDFFEEQVKGKYWNWCEIQESDIEDSVSRYNLINYDEDNFYKSVWACKKKI